MGNNGNGGPDWDSAWRSVQQQMSSQVEIKNGPRAQPRRPAPRVRNQTEDLARPGAGWSGQEGERIRRAERVLLDLWSSEDFLKVSTIGTVLVLLAVVLVAGPPTGAPEGFDAPPPPPKPVAVPGVPLYRGAVPVGAVAEAPSTTAL